MACHIMKVYNASIGEWCHEIWYRKLGTLWLPSAWGFRLCPHHRWNSKPCLKGMERHISSFFVFTIALWVYNVNEAYLGSADWACTCCILYNKVCFIVCKAVNVPHISITHIGVIDDAVYSGFTSPSCTGPYDLSPRPCLLLWAALHHLFAPVFLSVPGVIKPSGVVALSTYKAVLVSSNQFRILQCP